jgi:transcriptional regulator with XRE-family HTH domain
MGAMTAPGGEDGQLYELIDARRQQLDLTWAELADLAEVSRNTFRNVRGGRMPRKETREKIETALKIPRGTLSPAVTPTTVRLSPEDMEWLAAVVTKATEIEQDAGPEVADAYLIEMVKRRRAERREANDPRHHGRDVG